MINGEEAIKIAFSVFEDTVMVGDRGRGFSGSQRSETTHNATVAQPPWEWGDADASVEYRTPRTKSWNEKRA